MASGEGNKRRQIATSLLPHFAAICHWCGCGLFRWPNGEGDGVFRKLPADKGKTNAKNSP
jgi:hypothetical protein